MREGAKTERHPAFNRLAYKAGASSLDSYKVIVSPFLKTNVFGAKIQRYLFSRVHTVKSRVLKRLIFKQMQLFNIAYEKDF